MYDILPTASLVGMYLMIPRESEEIVKFIFPGQPLVSSLTIVNTIKIVNTIRV